jgi:hypothetical protein
MSDQRGIGWKDDGSFWCTEGDCPIVKAEKDKAQELELERTASLALIKEVTERLEDRTREYMNEKEKVRVLERCETILVRVFEALMANKKNADIADFIYKNYADGIVRHNQLRVKPLMGYNPFNIEEKER